MSEIAYIDQLLKAEEEANEIIGKAQKERQKKLKEARDAAELEVENYRSQKQAEFSKMKERKEDKEYEEVLAKETATEILQIRKDFDQNKEEVIEMLVNKVLDVDLSIPNSVKEKFIKKEDRK